MPKQDLSARRKEIIRQQLYGKEVINAKAVKFKPENKKETVTPQSDLPKLPETNHTENNYLKRDLLKILIISLIAFSVQFGLFWALNNHLIKLPMLD